MLLVAARERCNTSCLTGELSPCLESCVSVSSSRRFAYDRPVRRAHVLTNVTACCLTHGCISIPSTNRKRTGTWDPRRAVRSSHDKLVSKPLRRPGKRTRERIAASSKKTEYHRRARSTHGDSCEEETINRRKREPSLKTADSKTSCHQAVWCDRDDRSVDEGVWSVELEKVEVCEDCERWRMEKTSAVIKFGE